jgi:hypothetical protein
VQGNLEDVFKSTQEHNICDKYMKIIAEMNKNNITKIKAGNT